MPFYEYECPNCHFRDEVLQKINDKPLKKCPSCGKNGLRKLMSAPVFRLKGSGWYETDFRNHGTAPTGSGDASADAGKGTPSAEAPKGEHAAEAAKPAHAGSGEAAAAPTKPDAPVASAAGHGASCASH